MLNSDFRQIVRTLQRISEYGALERYFRPEWKFKDNVSALPVTQSKLRLYCLRLSDKILILGNGGKKQTRTYEQDNNLSGYVLTLQKFEELLNSEKAKGNVEITESHIKTDKAFKLWKLAQYWRIFLRILPNKKGKRQNLLLISPIGYMNLCR